MTAPETDAPHSIPASETPDDNKVTATLAAELALIGGGLHHLSSGAYLVTRFGMSREFPELRAVAAFVQQMTGRRA